jgi:hypothetical protein
LFSHTVGACVAIAFVLACASASEQRRSEPSITPQALAKIWDAEHVSPPLPPLVDHADVVRRLNALVKGSPDLFSIEKLGESVEGRSINYVRAGSGPLAVLLWSQMHGDEPTATSALFDVFEYLRAHRQGPVVRRLLSRLTLHVVPMLNPDGAERFQRRNAQGIDINRDALRLQTAEGRLLKGLRDRVRPRIGFNLHNQSWRTSVGNPPKPASISLLSVAYDEKRTENSGRTLTKKVCAVIRNALEPFAPGQIGRYDDEFEVRAFGDNLTLWGTPVVLIESGGLPPGRPLTDLTRLNFVALLTALAHLARDDVRGHDPAVYEALLRNANNVWSDVVLRGGQVVQPEPARPYRADVAFDRRTSDQFRAGCAPEPAGSRITEVGDARFAAAGQKVDATGSVIAPAFIAWVRGLEARAWLTPTALEAIGRLGVGDIRWRVAAGEEPAAAAHAATLAAAGRPTVIATAADERLALLVLAAAPETPRAPTLGAALDTLSPGWRERLGARALMPALAARIGIDGPANLVQLRLGPSATLDPDEVRLERVWIDGRSAR